MSAELRALLRRAKWIGSSRGAGENDARAVFADPDDARATYDALVAIRDDGARQTPMKTYQHRATVKAARILRIDPGDHAPFWPDLDGGDAEEMSYSAWSAAAKDVLAGNALGYFVLHPDGRDGYVPKAVFEAEYAETSHVP